MFDPFRRPSTPSLSRLLFALGLVALGACLGARFAPALRRWRQQRALAPRISTPPREIDRWANEGGAVAAPAFPTTGV